MSSACITLFLLYGMAVLPFIYLFSFMIEVTATGYVVTALFNIITGAYTRRFNRFSFLVSLF